MIAPNIILNMTNIKPTIKQLPPLSLYIHIPWCVKKCPYCDFNSHNMPSTSLPEDLYVEALINDLTQALPLIWGRSIRTIFIGGGTPSLFSGRAINAILDAVRSLTNLSPFAEITIEANPGATDDKHLKDYASAGINRISFGIQSFNDAHLKQLGRIHDSSTAISSIRLAQQYFNNINLDLIYGLPNQTLDELVSDLDIATSFKTNHLSLYNLTIEPNTAFHKNVPQGLPDNDLCYLMQDEIIKRLTQNGYSRYEISAYAMSSDMRCQHNLNYWQFGDYLGIGAGAHSKLSMHDRIIRQVRQKNPRSYMEALNGNNVSNMSNQPIITSLSHIIEDKVITANELPFEFALNAFRLIDGWDSQIFVERTGLPLNMILTQLLDAQKQGFITMNGSEIKPNAVYPLWLSILF